LRSTLLSLSRLPSFTLATPRIINDCRYFTLQTTAAAAAAAATSLHHRAIVAWVASLYTHTHSIVPTEEIYVITLAAMDGYKLMLGLMSRNLKCFDCVAKFKRTHTLR
jgi:hypothetical protein